MNWYLIPIDQDGNHILQINENGYDTTITPASNIEYWFDNSDFTSGGAAISRGSFNNFVITARYFNMPNFKIVYNSDDENPIYYSFVNSGLSNVGTLECGAVQVIHNADIVNVIDLEARTLKQANGNTELAKVYYEEWLNEEIRPIYYWTVSEFDSEETEGNVVYFKTSFDSYESYVLIPLDENSNEDLRLFVS